MKAHIVLAHPEAQSFNGKLASLSSSTLTELGWETTLTDLYQVRFDPCEGPRNYASLFDSERFHAQTEQRYHAEQDSTPRDVADEGQRLLTSDLLVVHFPLWWFGMPAILKGWIDRVFVYGVLYKGQMRYDTGICRGKRMLACITTAASAESCSFNGREGDAKLHAWPMLFPFRYIGYDVLEPVFLHGVGGVASTEASADGLSGLDRYELQWAQILTTLDTRCVTPFNKDTDFDESNRLVADAPVYSPFVAHSSNTPWE